MSVLGERIVDAVLHEMNDRGLDDAICSIDEETYPEFKNALVSAVDKELRESMLR